MPRVEHFEPLRENRGRVCDRPGAVGWIDGSKDAALLVTLDPGTYTVIVPGKDGGTGMALVEIYERP